MMNRLLSRMETSVVGKTAIVLMASTLVALSLIGCGNDSNLQGTVLDDRETLPDFELNDQYGKLITSSDLHGSVIVLTFMYTHCTDICPLVTEALRETQDRLGNSIQGVKFIVITTDPENDSVQRLYEFSREKGMLDRWTFLTGTREEVEPLWAHYYVYVESDELSHGEGSIDHSHIDDDTDRRLYTHSSPVFLFDQLGKRRVVFSSVVSDITSLVHDIRILLDDRS